MLRAVFDTNVLISAAVFGGIPYRCIQLALHEQFELILSPPILEEFTGVLKEKFQDADPDTFATEAQIRQIARIVRPSETLDAIVQDPTDHKILEAAIAGEAEVIVTGDHHLLGLRKFRGTIIMSPNEFLALIKRSRRSRQGLE